MEKNKRYVIRRYSDHRTVAWFEAESFDHFVGTPMVAFKDRWGSIHSVVNLEAGHYITLFDSNRDTE